MSLTMGFFWAVMVIVLGAAALTMFAAWLVSTDSRERASNEPQLIVVPSSYRYRPRTALLESTNRQR